MERRELNHRIAVLLSTVDAVDLHDVAELVVDDLADDELRDVLRISMREYVRCVIGLQRIATLAPSSPAAEGVKEAVPRPGRARRAVAFDAWRAKLDVLVSTSDNTYLRLGDCTVAEVEFLVVKLERQITAATIRHDFYLAIAKAMREHGVTRVADLPDGVLRALLDEEAA